MENYIKENNISYDYYLETENYLKTLFKILPEEMVSNEKRYAIIKQFNYLMGELNKDELKNILISSRIYSEKMASIPTEYANFQAMYIYNTFLDNMLFDSYHQKEYFLAMNECIKITAGFYRYIKEYEETASYYSKNYETVNSIGSR